MLKKMFNNEREREREGGRGREIEMQLWKIASIHSSPCTSMGLVPVLLTPVMYWVELGVTTAVQV